MVTPLQCYALRLDLRACEKAVSKGAKAVLPSTQVMKQLYKRRFLTVWDVYNSVASRSGIRSYNLTVVQINVYR